MRNDHLTSPPANVLSARRIREPLGWRTTGVTRTILALLPLAVAFVLQLLLLGLIRPYIWVLFYAAVFVSAWIGGLRLGLLATVLGTLMVWWFFVPPEHVWLKEPQWIFPAGVFFAMGVLFAAFHHNVKQSKDRLTKAVEERQLFATLVDNSVDFIGIAGPDGTPIYLNPAGRRMVGLPDDHPIASTKVVQFYSPEQPGIPSRATIEKTMDEHGVWRGETFFRNWLTHEPVPVWATNFTIRDPDTGQLLGRGTITRDISERKRLERSLREASDDLARAQAVAEVGSWRLDMRRNELTWTDETYRLFGLAAGTPMTYETFLACVHPDDRAYVKAQWTAALRGAPYDIEHRIVAGDTIRWVREKAELEFDAEGGLLGGIGIVQNVTERRRLEDELRLSEARASGIVSISADAIISIDDRHRITMFNEGAEEIFGYTRDEALGAPLDILVPERLRALHRAEVDRFAAGDAPSRRMGARLGQIRGVRKNGEEFPADASISKLEVGGTRIFTVSLRDITEQKRVEAEHTFLAEVGAVLSSTLDFDATITNIAELATRELADFCIVDMIDEAGANRRFKVACRDPAKAWVCDVIARVEPEHSYMTTAVFDTRHSVLLQRITPDMLGSFARSDEHLAALQAVDPGSAMAVPLVARGVVLGAIGFVASRGARTYGPDDLALAEELARRAAQSVESARLYRTARRAIQSRDDVLGVVAHDLRNPLNAITLQAALVRQRGNEQQRVATEAIERAATRMDRLIQDLLDVTRMESDRLPLEQARIATATILSTAVDTQRALAASASIDLELALSPDLPDVWADRDRVLQIFENLIGNAIKFTQRGGRIIVGAAPRDGAVLFWVADTGQGIEPEHQAHVFDRFWQTREARHRGAGLGLPIVKGLVEAHGGRIWLESAPGRGTTFFFTLPAGQPDEAWAQAAHAP